ncbi:ATP-binding cassette domain-containing protein [Mesorhizobium sp. ORM6]
MTVAADAQTAFRIDAVRFAVGGRTLLGPVSLQPRRSRAYGLIGHYGWGKSTLIKLLARQQPASSGAITFARRPLPQWGARELARALAYPPQTTPAATGLTVPEQATLTCGIPGEIMRSDVLKGIFGVETSVFAHPATGQPVGYMQ